MGCEGGAVGGDEGGGEIEWKQKNKSEYGTCDKNILTPPSIKKCHLFDEVRKGDFIYPPPSQMFQCHHLGHTKTMTCKPVWLENIMLYQ